MRYLILFFTTLTFAQINSAKISYGVTIGIDEKYQTSSLKDYYQSAIDKAKHLEFELLSNKYESVFRQIESNQLGNNDNAFALGFSGYDAPIFSENESSFLYSNIDDKVLGKYSIKKEKNTNWEISKETKTIESYVCYKATTIDTVINEAGTFKFDVTAWFCPKIPLSFGPNGYGGLPGLILELNRRNVVFGVTKIELNPKNLEEIKKPDLSLIKTEDEINKKRQDFIDSMKD